jgi:hypothetical protein
MGQLAAGPPSGQFAYYKFEYPGDESTLTIEMEIFPDQHNVLLNAGFNVYGPESGALYLRGTPLHQHRPNVTGDFRGVHAGTYIVQVYNYDPVLPIDFEIRRA